MRDDLRRALARFPDVVLTGRDPSGAPVSVRRRPTVDGDRLRLPRAPGVELADGPASILGHSHDERLWRLRSFVAPGTVVAEGAEWLFRPSGLVPGTGVSGPVGDLRGFVATRRRAGRWSAHRGLARPRIPWARFR